VAGAVGEVRDRIAAAAAVAGRDPASVTLVAATKTVSVAQVRAVVAAGVLDLGENRAQELLAKAAELAERPGEMAAELAERPVLDAPRWHFLGHLQRNKVRALAPWVACWESVDRAPLGDELATRAPGARVFVEVNLGEEPQKGGCAPGALAGLVEHLVGVGLAVEGLMAVPPNDGEPRRWFSLLREMGSRLGLVELSMGMSDDFEVAVAEGATVVRIGRALFGPRS
jgi:pyridoxal phosphate enzyme (YggS family)